MVSANKIQFKNETFFSDVKEHLHLEVIQFYGDELHHFSFGANRNCLPVDIAKRVVWVTEN